MPFKLPINVRETTATTGTGDITLGGAKSGARAFSADLADQDETIWILAPEGSVEREVHKGAWSSAGNTLTRSTSTLIESTTGALINLPAGTHEIFVGAEPNRIVHLEKLKNYGLFLARNNSVLSSPQSITHNTFTKVGNSGALENEVVDDQGWYDLANARYTPQRPGVYLTGGSVVLAGTDDQALVIVMTYKNGVLQAILNRGANSGTSTIGFGGSTVVTMNGTTDHLEIYVFHGSSSSKILRDNAFYQTFWAYWAGELPL